MTKTELVASIAEKAGMTKDAEIGLNGTLAAIEDALVKGEKVQLIGFGTFEVKERGERQGRNPQKPDEIVTIPASKAPVFKAGKSLKDAVNNK